MVALAREPGVGLEAHAAAMLRSSNELVRAAGAVLLIESRTLTAEDAAGLGAERAVLVPLIALERLQDLGRAPEAALLLEALKSEPGLRDRLLAAFHAGALSSGGGRAALDVLVRELETAEAASLCLALAADDGVEYGLRMKALVELRAVAGFIEYREAAGSLAAEPSAADDPIWSDWLQRTADRLAGPVEVVGRTPSLGPDAVDALLAQDYPLMCEDLALTVEAVCADTNSRVTPGTAARVTEHLIRLSELPLPDSDRLAIERVEARVGLLGAIERERPAPPEERPPGSEG